MSMLENPTPFEKWMFQNAEGVETFPRDKMLEKAFNDGMKIGEDKISKNVLELQADKGRLTDEVNEFKKRFEPQVFTEILDEVEENYNNKVRLTEAKEILSNILSDNRIMKAQFESEEQAQVWFEHIEQAEDFLKE